MTPRIFCVVGLLLAVLAPAQAQDPLRIFDGIWVTVTPPVGRHVIFNKVGLGQREASLPVIGQASIRVSDGRDGSNFKVSGPGFDCYYFVGKINERKMTWELMSGASLCPKSAAYEKDPP